MTPTDGIALLGAATGVMALALSIMQERRHHRTDRAVVRLSASVHLASSYSTVPLSLVLPSGGPQIHITGGDYEAQILFTITNTGRRRVVVKQFEHIAALDGPWTWSDSHGLPRTLDEGEEHEITISATLFETHKVQGFRVRDTGGRTWELTHRDFLKLQADTKTALGGLKEIQRAQLSAKPPKQGSEA